ncbi:MAG: hypothetical protein HOM11_05485 [Methylococcales bacterium]|jgi:hypothetical protein|nr:hypothetical protein [Methylococcales bacterium]MBT7444524.1 hypothetical protein [Methylococcales bacterium]
MYKLMMLMVSLFALPVFAALPPQYQNMDDLEVMVGFVKQHERVAGSLRLINLEEYTVYFGDDCKATFHRKHIPKAEGWVGPADPLEFDLSTCPIQ